MKVYFDTNIYSMITEHQNQDDVRNLLAQNSVTLIASGENLIETWAIKSPSIKRREIETLTKVATRFEEYPGSFLDAMELLAEIKRLRTRWCRKIPHGIMKRNEFFSLHREKWILSKQGRMTELSSEKTFYIDKESAIRISREYQKNIRSARTSKNAKLNLVQVKGEIIEAEIELDLDDLEKYWRTSNLTAWFAALVQKNPSSREYLDWLSPFLWMKEIENGWNEFWIERVSAENMPRNRLQSLIEYFQLKHKISHGNALDCIHATHSLNVNYFLTADKNFAKVLKEAQKIINAKDNVVFVKRDKDNIVEIMNNLLDVR